MDDTLNSQKNIPEDSVYVTPFNVDLFGVKPENYFEVYSKMVLSLPESIRNILMDFSTAEFIEENLGLNFSLNKEQKTKITRIIRDVLLGDLFIGEMSQNISVRMGLAPDEARGIKDLIVSELFKPATEDIKKLQTERFPEKINRPSITTEPQVPKIPDRPDLKIESDINRNNIVDLRNK